MKKIIAYIFLAALIVLPFNIALATDIDLDGNQAVDVEFGGTNGTTAAGARENLSVPQIHESTTDPDTDDDATNYNEGDIWINTTHYRIWYLYDSTDAAAVWHIASQLPIKVNGNISSNTEFEGNKTHTLTITGDFTLSVNWSTNPGRQITEFIITGNASNSITWPTVNWSFSTAPTQPFAASPQIIQLMTINAGTTVYGFEIGSDMGTP